jgi:hypothetical protein
LGERQVGGQKPPLKALPTMSTIVGSRLRRDLPDEADAEKVPGSTASTGAR